MPTTAMHLAHDIDPARLAGVRGVFADIDETISTQGKITAEAYEAIWRLHDAGLKVVPVTGRAAGWCDHIARFWPVDAVVGENGGFYFHHDGSKLHQRFLNEDAERAGFRKKLESIRDEILATVPGCGISSDQLYREYDLAIDFCEDVEPLPREQVLEIQAIFERHGAHAKISSVHVNGWFGDFDKLSTTRLCADELFGADLDTENDTFVFCGDSPNDEPMFDFFNLSFGMANVEPYLDLMEHAPAFVTSRSSGAGFVEVADLILKARSDKGVQA
jgi:HAD superfamily hydrolase (TIGR01484 family)